MFIAAVFIITPNWKQARCPSVEEKINIQCKNGKAFSAKKISYQSLKRYGRNLSAYF